MLKLRSICTTLIGGKVYNINGKTIREEKLLSEGAYSFVYLAKDLNTNKSYTIKKTICQDKEKLEMAKKEIQILKTLPPHKNIVQYFGSTIISENNNRIVIMLMDFCERGNLLNIFQKNKEKIKENHIVKIIKDIVNGLNFLHTQEIPIIHRDIKLENILCDKNGVYKICDFCSHSVSTSFFPNDLTKDSLNILKEEIERDTTFMYRPPELIDLYANREISCKVDVWMVGCILYLLLFKVHPFQNEHKSLLSIINGSFTIPYHLKYSKKIMSILLMTLNKNPEKRLDSTTLLFILENYADLKLWFMHIPSDVKKMVNQIFEKINELNLNKENEVIEISNDRILDVKISSHKYQTQVPKSAPRTFFKFFSPSVLAQDPLKGNSSQLGDTTTKQDSAATQPVVDTTNQVDTTKQDNVANKPDDNTVQLGSTTKEGQLISIESSGSVADLGSATQNEFCEDFLNLNGDTVQTEEQKGNSEYSSWRENNILKDITLDREMNTFGFDMEFGCDRNCDNTYRSEGGDAVTDSTGKKEDGIPVGKEVANMNQGLKENMIQEQRDFKEFFDPWNASKGNNGAVTAGGTPTEDGQGEGNQYDLFEEDLANFDYANFNHANFNHANFQHANFFKDTMNNEPFKYAPSVDEINFTKNGTDMTNDTLNSISNYDDLDNMENYFPSYGGAKFGKEVEVAFNTGVDVFNGATYHPSSKFIASDKNDKFSELLEEFQKCSI
ncbi:serine/threonine protein kinase, putative [Plasmodium knowlesi strain H]|uniref:non-specific serine/threonine protein kinase n=3 Tax=Plasmodium knowlesi TaxID=5850 RepID=A0A5K1U9P0_PLAKH|nr:serine/threonine protein kinase, putative [Plasmodium knowlesi strain H]OTN64069.1 putative Cyclin g-associated kinase [Plasmodium knowlesi]CAA9991269.1 serine/threonine protein kinase, putative [Plasmodium knowlesi strain H]SBO26356.1 serine/threonine protein kinase, putative [Plasmodium knowlesi strain H]SBO29024.1 serine/threonine protein kinase, putative [Plasmodium knowlesi strain H]VVS80743.1 serine/threonine protein kinase, putative [Plasmodium knowlesi strain H]|eukprot:XP_002262548.1 cyclin g-associated kinase, putative [Plasmodium knowlesi strain H]